MLNPYPRPAHQQISAKEAELAAAVAKIADLEQLRAAAAKPTGQALADKEEEAEELRTTVSRAAGGNRVRSALRTSCLCIGEINCIMFAAAWKLTVKENVTCPLKFSRGGVVPDSTPCIVDGFLMSGGVFLPGPS